MSSDLSHAPMGAAGLRPLSIGELFDRAFSIYLRNVLTFAALLIVIVAPIAAGFTSMWTRSAGIRAP